MEEKLPHVHGIGATCCSPWEDIMCLPELKQGLLSFAFSVQENIHIEDL